MPATNSVEWNVEELLIQKMQTSGALAGTDFRHHETAIAGAVGTIIVKAIKGERQLDGVKGWAVDGYVTFVSDKLTPSESDAIAAAIGEVVYLDDPGFLPVVPDLAFISIEPNSETSREDTKKLRRRVVKFPTIAALIP